MWSNVRAILFTKWPLIRVARLFVNVCSWVIDGIRFINAPMTTGTETYPPNETTIVGFSCQKRYVDLMSARTVLGKSSIVFQISLLSNFPHSIFLKVTLSLGMMV